MEREMAQTRTRTKKKPQSPPEWARNAAKAALGILGRDNSAEKSKDTSSKETKEQNEETNREEEDAPERDNDSEDDVIHNGNYRRKRKRDGEQDGVQGTSRDGGSSSKRQRSGRGGGVKKGKYTPFKDIVPFE
ncbi:hypothetical protein OEA41_004943 [Lepraria neglecta]|uniref:Uncharacterized protein n=1 Tax=Lepraria neglecta TaxID=209136 RepID=A0AAD9YZL2_9LECA|nr:hypothetical protein OEA41_004943 [Lepraria neglecta]